MDEFPKMPLYQILDFQMRLTKGLMISSVVPVSLLPLDFTE